MTETIHIRPNAPVAERVLLPGDPGRALRLAQLLMHPPAQMLNHHRGLWGYSGTALDGEPLTIQSTGMGAPSAAIVVEELIALGARRLLRVGTCGALVPGLRLGELLAADRVLGADGVSRGLDAEPVLEPDAGILGRLVDAPVAAVRSGTVVTSDLFYDPDPSRAAAWIGEGAVAVEMEAAAILAVCARHGARAGCVLIVSDELAGGARRRIEVDALHAAEEPLGRVAAYALGA